MPIEIAKPGDNLFWHMSQFRNEYTQVPMLGLWCSPHKVDLVADAITDNEKRLPTFFGLASFLKKLCNHIEYSGKQQVDIHFLNQMMLDERIRTGSMRISHKTWISNVGALKEVMHGMGVVYAHLQQVKKAPRNATQKSQVMAMLQIVTSARVHLVMPAYLDIQSRLQALNLAFDRDSLNVNDVSAEIFKFKLWVHNYALRTRHEGANNEQEGEPAKATGLITQWGRGTLPEDPTPGASNLERALRRLKLVEIGEGDEARQVLEYVTLDVDHVERVITMEAQTVKQIEIMGSPHASCNRMFRPDGLKHGQALFKAVDSPAVIFWEPKESKWRLSRKGLMDSFDYEQMAATTIMCDGKWRHKDGNSQCDAKATT